MLTCFLFAALIIDTVQHKLIDIQESPLVQTEHEPNRDHEQDHDLYDKCTMSFTSRRHSIQEDRISNNIFEQQFAKHMQISESDNNGWDETPHLNDNRRFHASALNWLRHFNLVRDKCQYDTISQRRFKNILRKTSSENELLLMSPTNDLDLGEFPAIRRSISSGLLF